MTVGTETFRRQLSRTVTGPFRDPELRRTCLAFTAAGSAISILFVLIPVFAVTELGADVASVGLLFVLVTLTAIPTSLALGRLADRSSKRRVLGVCSALWVCAGCAAMLVVDDMVHLVVVSVVFLGMLEAANSQLFAAGRGAADRPGARTELTALMRTAYALGYVLGPVIGTALLTAFGVRVALAACALIYLGTLDVHVMRRAPDERKAAAGRAVRPAPGLGWLLAALGLVLTAPIVRSAYLVVFVTTDVGLPLAQVLLVLGVAPLAELVLIPICGVAAVRWGPDRVVLAGCVAAGVEMALLSHVGQVWQLALLQVLGALAVACVVSVGMAAVQERFPRRDAFGTSVFAATRAVASLLGNGIGGLVGSAFGLRWVFLAAAMCSFAAAGLCVLARRPVHADSPD